MKFIDEYRNKQEAVKVLDAIKKRASFPCCIMEVCGGQTHTIVKYGIDTLLPDTIRLVHGPGCPVCVTPVKIIEKAIVIASSQNVIFTSFGDMLRVPGLQSDLLKEKAKGADVRIVYSPLDALQIALDNPFKKVVFFGIGFETTAPVIALAIWMAKVKNIKNFSVLGSNLLVPPAIEVILSSPKNRINAFIGPGHVITVTGTGDYERLAADYKTPIVVAGFEPVDLLLAIYKIVVLLDEKKNICDNQYKRSVKEPGNSTAKGYMDNVYNVCDRAWRGIGVIPGSGLCLKDEFTDWDADKLFHPEINDSTESGLCIAGQIMIGEKKPDECPAFGKECTPLNPLGAPMVSSEGACCAYYQYRRDL